MEQYQGTPQSVQRARLFAEIDAQDIPHMLRCISARERSYAKGEFVFWDGEDLQLIGLVIEGSVHMIKEDEQGNKMLLAAYTDGEVFGESFVCNDQMMATVSFQTAADCRILLIPFHRLLRTCGMACRFHHQLIENMVFLMARKNVQLMDKIIILSKKSIREKILAWLSLQVEANACRRFTSAMGRVELAEYLCVDRSALTRELSNMRADGLLNYDKNTFELLPSK